MNKGGIVPAPQMLSVWQLRQTGMQTVVIQRNNYSHGGRTGVVEPRERSILDFGSQGQLPSPGTGRGRERGREDSEGCKAEILRLGCHLSTNERAEEQCSRQSVHLVPRPGGEKGHIQGNESSLMWQDGGGCGRNGGGWAEKWTQAGPPRAFRALAGEGRTVEGGEGVEEFQQRRTCSGRRMENSLWPPNEAWTGSGAAGRPVRRLCRGAGWFWARVMDGEHREADPLGVLVVILPF